MVLIVSCHVAMPFVAMKPPWQFGGAFMRSVVRSGVSPFAQARLDEVLDLTVLSSPGLQFVLTLERV